MDIWTFLRVLPVAILSTAQSWAVEPTIDAARELSSNLDAAASVLGEVVAFDLVGRSDATNRFKDELVQSEIVDFRLQVDLKNERLTWATKGVTELLRPDGSVRTSSVQYYGVTIHGNRSVVVTHRGKNDRNFSSFMDAMHESGIPLPQYWGVVQFPCFSNEKKELLRLNTMIANAKTQTFVRATESGIKFVARYEESDVKFDIHTWTFALPDYEVLNFKVDRAIKNGKLVNYFLQDVFWETRLGRRVPVRLSTRNGVVRPKNAEIGVQGGIEVGDRFVDTDVVWLHIGDDIPSSRRKIELQSVVAIQKFLDAGEKFAKNLGQY